MAGGKPVAVAIGIEKKSMLDEMPGGWLIGRSKIFGGLAGLGGGGPLIFPFPPEPRKEKPDEEAGPAPACAAELTGAVGVDGEDLMLRLPNILGMEPTAEALGAVG